MASSVYGLTSFVVIITIVLTGFGSAVLIKTEPKQYNETTGSDLNVSCIADGPKYLYRKVMIIQIGKQGQGSPIVTVTVNENPEMAPHSKDTMTADGYIDNADNSGRSHLNLTIKNPSAEDSGLYTCLMLVREANLEITEQIDTAQVKYDDSNLRAKLTNLTKEFYTLTRGLNLPQNNTRRVEKQKQDFDNLVAKTKACPRGWSFYIHDNTCLKGFGGNRRGPASWKKARSMCKRYGADLVQIHDGYKNNFVNDSTHIGRYPAWTGIKNNGKKDKDFRYINGSSLGKYHPWSQKYPKGDAVFFKSTCVLIMNGEWFDKTCASRERYVCSKPSRNVF